MVDHSFSWWSRRDRNRPRGTFNTHKHDTDTNATYDALHTHTHTHKHKHSHKHTHTHTHAHAHNRPKAKLAAFTHLRTLNWTPNGNRSAAVERTWSSLEKRIPEPLVSSGLKVKKLSSSIWECSYLEHTVAHWARIKCTVWVVFSRDHRNWMLPQLGKKTCVESSLATADGWPTCRECSSWLYLAVLWTTQSDSWPTGSQEKLKAAQKFV